MNEDREYGTMIIAIVQFTLPTPVDREAALQLFNTNAHLYEGRADLKQKFYVRSPDGRVVGAIFFWRSLEEAAAFYSEDWHAHVYRKYGVRPTITLFESPLVVSND